MRAWYLGISLLSFVAGGCGTLTGATVGGAAGAGIGAATHSNVGKSAAIGAGVGGTAVRSMMCSVAAGEIEIMKIKVDDSGE